MKLDLEFDQNYWDRMQQVVNAAVESKISSLQKQSKTAGTATVKEAAKYLNVAETTILEYIKKGKIPAKKIGKKYIIQESDIEKALSDAKSLKYKRQ